MKHMHAQLQKLDENDVRKAYKRWAPVYDAVFGKIVEAGVKQAAARANAFSGKLLEVGVGTGLALRHYGPQLKVTGIDLSADMLKLARKRMKKSGHGNIEALLEMDATSLAFQDNYFDIVVASYVLTVVPNPAKVIHELARVTKPGGIVLIVNHFSVESGLRGAIEKSLAKHASKLGWRPEFRYETLLVSERLLLTSIEPVKPLGFFTMLEFRKLN
jgi:phosphatidylethanolamine/phosphatidyl-N-methylethanolamine N-methyltransferase